MSRVVTLLLRRHLGVRADFPPVVAQVAFHAEAVDRRCVIHAHLLLLGVEPHAYRSAVAQMYQAKLVRLCGHLPYACNRPHIPMAT